MYYKLISDTAIEALTMPIMVEEELYFGNEAEIIAAAGYKVLETAPRPEDTAGTVYEPRYREEADTIVQYWIAVPSADIPTKLSQLTNDAGYITDLSVSIGANGNWYVGGKDTGKQAKGDSYILTAADKAEIANQVEDAVIVPPPKYVNSVEEMTDTNKVYVLASTGKIWAYMDTATETEVTVRNDIIGTTENPYSENSRFSSGGEPSTQSGYTITPYIDLTKAEYQGKTIKIHLDGNRYASEAQENYIMCAYFDTSKNVIVARTYTMLDQSGNNLLVGFDNAGMTLEIHSQTSATLTFPVPLASDDNKTVGYFRFCGLGTAIDSVYITYQDVQTVTGGRWVDTGTSYSPALSAEDMNTVAQQAAAIVDGNLLALIGTGEVSV